MHTRVSLQDGDGKAESHVYEPYGERDTCKGCTASVQVDKEQIRRILNALSAHPDQCVSEEEYAKRLEICQSCPSLTYDTTCSHCGCLVAIRAKLKNNACPYPGQAKW